MKKIKYILGIFILYTFCYKWLPTSYVFALICGFVCAIVAGYKTFKDVFSEMLRDIRQDVWLKKYMGCEKKNKNKYI